MGGRFKKVTFQQSFSGRSNFTKSNTAAKPVRGSGGSDVCLRLLSVVLFGRFPEVSRRSLLQNICFVLVTRNCWSVDRISSREGVIASVEGRE